jgi:hypothetical protein
MLCGILTCVAMGPAFVDLTSPARFVLRNKGRSGLCIQTTPRSRIWPSRATRARVFACAFAQGEDTVDDTDPMNLEAKPLKWAEIPFTSLAEELDAVDEYVKEEQIDKDDSWPRYLRGAAYEHWGQPALALAQYDTCDSSKGLKLVPEFWLRRAYNAFKTEQVEKAVAYHDKAKAINADAVGNQLHFSFWFDTNFKDFKPRHNGPSYSVQRGICMYMAGRHEDARESLAPFLLLGRSSREDLGLGALWFLAASHRVRKSKTLNATIEKDIALVRPIMESSSLSATLKPLVPLFEGKSEQLEEAKKAAMEGDQGEDGAMLRAFYVALYFDALTDDSSSRDEWLNRALAAHRSGNSDRAADFMYYAAKNKLTMAATAKES